MLNKINMPFTIPGLLLRPSEKITKNIIKFREKKKEIAQTKWDLEHLELSEEVTKVIEELFSSKKVKIRSYDGRILSQLISILTSNLLFSERFDYKVSVTEKKNSQTGQRDFIVKLIDNNNTIKVRKL